MSPSVAELLGFRTGNTCGGCSRWITSEPYYAVEVPDLEDLVYIDGQHANCLAEWGWSWGEDGPAHIHYDA